MALGEHPTPADRRSSRRLQPGGRALHTAGVEVVGQPVLGTGCGQRVRRPGLQHRRLLVQHADIGQILGAGLVAEGEAGILSVLSLHGIELSHLGLDQALADLGRLFQGSRADGTLQGVDGCLLVARGLEKHQLLLLQWRQAATTQIQILELMTGGGNGGPDHGVRRRALLRWRLDCAMGLTADPAPRRVQIVRFPAQLQTTALATVFLGGSRLHHLLIAPRTLMFRSLAHRPAFDTTIGIDERRVVLDAGRFFGRETGRRKDELEVGGVDRLDQVLQDGRHRVGRGL